MTPPSPPNPFSAAAVSGGRLPFMFSDSSAERELLDTLDRHRWVGQIVGPHGSGKTTLTHHLWKETQTQFGSLVQITIRSTKDIQRRVSGKRGRRLFVVDGLERLSMMNRWLFLGGFVGPAFAGPAFGRRQESGQADGLIATVHRRLPWLPTVFETTFDEVLLNRLVKELLGASWNTKCSDNDGGVFVGQQWTEISCALLQRYGGNGREILMELYDLYEANSTEKLRSKNPFLLSISGV